MAATLERPATIKLPEKPGGPTPAADQPGQKPIAPKKKVNLKLILILEQKYCLLLIQILKEKCR